MFPYRRILELHEEKASLRNIAMITQLLLLVYNAFLLIAYTVQFLMELVTHGCKNKGKKDDVFLFPVVLQT